MGELRKSDAGTKLTLEHKSLTQRQQTLILRGEALAMDGERAMLFTLEDVTSQRQEEESVGLEKSRLNLEIAQSARQLERTQEELRGLTAHLFTVQDEERRHVARELHDDISQNLSLLDLQLKSLKDKQGNESIDLDVDALRYQLEQLANDVRQISHRLHPAILDDLGLLAALKALVEEFGEREAMPATFSSINVSESIPTNVASVLYRITQEALRNVSKHAGKTHVKVILEGNENLLSLQVVDLGLGFDQEAELAREGLGLISMTERARQIHGEFHIKSSLGKGTTVTVSVPMGPL
jgi:two-component system CheB/CheR fusion protein